MDNSSVSIRKLLPSDASKLAAVHMSAFPAFFLTSLGTRFVRRYYRAMAQDDWTVGRVALVDGVVIGAAIGTLQPAKTYRRMLCRHGLAFVTAAAPAVVQSPRSWRRLARAMLYRGQVVGRPTNAALLSSLLVAPGHAGQGIGTVALESWEQEVRQNGFGHAYATTDAVKNESALQFYALRGWTTGANFTTTEGRLMLTLERTLS